jgi:hypothetical protein
VHHRRNSANQPSLLETAARHGHLLYLAEPGVSRVAEVAKLVGCANLGSLTKLVRTALCPAYGLTVADVLVQRTSTVIQERMQSALLYLMSGKLPKTICKARCMRSADILRQA